MTRNEAAKPVILGVKGGKRAKEAVLAHKKGRLKSIEPISGDIEFMLIGRYALKAHLRNRIKRRIREILRKLYREGRVKRRVCVFRAVKAWKDMPHDELVEVIVRIIG